MSLTQFNNEENHGAKEDHVITTKALNSVSSSMALMTAGSSKRSCLNKQNGSELRSDTKTTVFALSNQ